ncbi:hypothetical protein SKAU_G00012690 [Synaphobranchus kaupii]|uniref:Uncharacterized protein n=1 Tax=Synaphobranchus kaupii TaxID=118154 RepID=A0A9Q1GAC2_SYNKA|nr:hypothetical protein SKAU_G00012690 [Synaphobranchus kaupii]
MSGTDCSKPELDLGLRNGFQAGTGLEVHTGRPCCVERAGKRQKRRVKVTPGNGLPWGFINKRPGNHGALCLTTGDDDQTVPRRRGSHCAETGNLLALKHDRDSCHISLAPTGGFHQAVNTNNLGGRGEGSGRRWCGAPVKHALAR